MLIRMIAVLALCTGVARAESTEIYGMSHEVVSPRDAASTKQLEGALRRFEREIAGKRGGSSAAKSKPKEIVVVGSKVKDVVRSPGARSGGFSDVSGLRTESDVVEYRSGGPTSLPQLQGAIRKFEATAGPRSPCVKKCRMSARQCLSRCSARMRKHKVRGKCICAHIRARCLVRSAKQGKCHPPDPGRRLRR